tara:strand:- start:127 stop:1380 length:1254 start_codon:yes stop_codon:yes gene_type:complete
MPDFQSAAGEYTSIRSGTRNVGSTIDGGSDPRELFLKLYAGEVMTAFQTRNVMMPLGRVRTISKGKEAQFIMTGKYRDAAYHTPGNRIAPDANAKHTERLVTIDDLLINAQFIPSIDEAIQHYDVRNVYTQEAGYGLSKVADQNILRVLTKASLATNVERASKLINNYKTFDQEDFSANITIGATADGSDSRKPQFIVKAIMDARRELEKIGAPLDGLVCIMSTDSYYDLFDSTSSSATDLAVFNRDFGGTGSIGAMQLPTIAGIPVVTTPHFGSYNSAGSWSNSIFSDLSTAGATGQASTGPTPISGESGRDKAYDITNNQDADYDASASAGSTTGADGGTDADGASVDLKAEVSKIRFFVMSKDAVATVKLMDLAVESEYQIDRQGTLIVSKYAMGHDVLRPAMAVACMSTHATG